jgi:hypothetical protein
MAMATANSGRPTWTTPEMSIRREITSVDEFIEMIVASARLASAARRWVALTRHAARLGSFHVGSNESSAWRPPRILAVTTTRGVTVCGLLEWRCHP